MTRWARRLASASLAASALAGATACSSPAPERNSSATTGRDSTPPLVPRLTAVQVIDSVFPELRLAALEPGQSVSHGRWVIALDSDSLHTLYLMRQVTAVTLPDGPVTLTEPISLFRFDDHAWQEQRLDSLQAPLPQAMSRALVATFTDRRKAYAYVIRSAPSRIAGPSAIRVLRELRAELDQRSTSLLARGFISADAEP